MTNNRLCWLSYLIRVYVTAALATVVVVAVLSAAAPHEATHEAWGHAIITAVFAVVLPLRLRSARAGHRSGLRAMGLIASVLFVVNVVGALIPGFFPTWMRIEMVGLAAQLAAVGLLVVRGAVDTDAPLTARHWPRVHER